MIGWIKLHRQMLNWEWYTDVNTTHLFTYLLLKANPTPSKFRGIQINAGELVAGRKALSTKTGLSEQQIRRSLDKLKSTNEIAIKSTNKYSIISIVKWSSYQASQPTDAPTTNQQTTTSKEYKNKRNKEYSDIPDGVSEGVWKDFLTIRKEKKAPLTETALNGIISEAAKAGFTLEQALSECCTRGWQGFRADWVSNGKKLTDREKAKRAMVGNY